MYPSNAFSLVYVVACFFAIHASVNIDVPYANCKPGSLPGSRQLDYTCLTKLTILIKKLSFYPLTVCIVVCFITQHTSFVHYMIPFMRYCDHGSLLFSLIFLKFLKLVFIIKKLFLISLCAGMGILFLLF